MKKLHVIAMADRREALLKGLLHLGCVEISQPEEVLSDPEWAALFRRSETLLTQRKAELTDVNTVLAAIGQYAKLKNGLFIKRHPITEAEFLDAWIQMGCSDELLLLARDRTIFQLQEFKWTYMNGILTRWYKEGLTTVEAVEASERKNRRPQYPRATPQPAQGAQPLPSDDIGRMIEQARRAAAAKEG